MKKILLLLFLPLFSYSQKLTPVPDAPIAKCMVEDTVNHLLYVGGDFEKIGHNKIKYIAVWDGRKWSSLGEGVNGWVSAMCLHDGILYVGGYFSKAGDEKIHLIAKWDGHSWSSLNFTHPFGADEWAIKSIAFYHDKLFVGGYFTSGFGPFGFSYLDGDKWVNMKPIEDCSGEVLCMTVYNDQLYAAGSVIKKLKEGKYLGVEKYDGKSWKFIPLPLEPTRKIVKAGEGIEASGPIIRDITFYNDNLYLGGNFKFETDKVKDARDIIRFDGKGFDYILDVSMNNNFNGFFMHNNLLYIYGSMSRNEGKKGYDYVTTWDGEKLKPLKLELSKKYFSPTISSLSSYDGDLFLSGNFENINNGESHMVKMPFNK